MCLALGPRFTIAGPEVGAHPDTPRLVQVPRSVSFVRVLEDWCEPFEGYYLYYPSRRQPSAAFCLLLEALRYRG